MRIIFGKRLATIAGLESTKEGRTARAFHDALKMAVVEGGYRLVVYSVIHADSCTIINWPGINATVVQGGMISGLASTGLYAMMRNPLDKDGKKETEEK